jgi:carotenoid cleavage dioxygenase-like enzyme
MIEENMTRSEVAADFAAAPPGSYNPYLAGVHSPMREELTIEDLPVTGSIPAALDGRYLRMGPNPMKPNPSRYHWFAGDGMIHGIAIENSKARWYRNRWIRSTAVSKAMHEQRVEGPRRAFDTVNTNVVRFAGKTLGLVRLRTASSSLRVRIRACTRASSRRRRMVDRLRHRRSRQGYRPGHSRRA